MNEHYNYGMSKCDDHSNYIYFPSIYENFNFISLFKYSKSFEGKYDNYCKVYALNYRAKNEKYQSVNFKKFLLEIQDNDMNKQKKLIEEEFDRWTSEHKFYNQIDDILIVGVEI